MTGYSHPEEKLLDAPISHDLRALSVYWLKNGKTHRIIEQQGLQCIYIPNSSGGDSHTSAELMREEYERFVNGDLQIQLTKAPRESSNVWLPVIAEAPVTVFTIVLSIIGFLLVEYNVSSIVDLLVIQQRDTTMLPYFLGISANISINDYLEHHQYWRLVTPIFLHFGVVHITFNALWMWELGRRIEAMMGSAHLLCLILFVGIGSNVLQAAETPDAFFGGLSGVIYGLLGYCAIYWIICPDRRVELPIQVYVLMYVSLVVGWLGIFDFLARMANTAHLTGLIWGLLIGVPSALISRFYQFGKTS